MSEERLLTADEQHSFAFSMGYNAGAVDQREAIVRWLISNGQLTIAESVEQNKHLRFSYER